MISYREIEPSTKLQPYLLNFWQFNFQDDDPKATLQHTVIPDGCVSLMLVQWGSQAAYSLLKGPHPNIQEVAVPAGSKYLGVRFQPYAMRSLFGFSPTNIREDTVVATPLLLNGLRVPLDAVMEQQIEDDFTALNRSLEIWIEQVEPGIDQRVARAINTIIEADGQLRIGELAKRVHWSERQLQRRFAEEIGLTPKEFSRIRRMRRALIEMVLHDKDRQDIVYEQGYFDPAHFVRDVSTIAGRSPALLAEYIARIEHTDVV